MIGLLCRIIKRILIDSSILILFFLLAPGLPPYNATFSSYSITPPFPLTGALEPNGELDSAQRLLEGKFTGPESIAWKTHDEIFLSIHGGTIIKVFGQNFDRIARVTRIGPTCDGPHQERLCGRPLGLRFAPDGKLLVVDAYYGIFSVDVDSGEKECLVSPDQDIENEPFKFANDLDIDSDGNIYWSDSSSIADLANGNVVVGADPTGRLIKYDPKTGGNVVLLREIHFANGVQLSSNQDFVLLCETSRNRIHRYWLKGDMTGRRDIFLDGLPGMCDNIRPRPDGGFYVSLVSTRIAGTADQLLSIFEKVAFLRKLVLRVLSVAQWIIDSTNKFFPHVLLEKASYNVLNMGPLMAAFKTNVSIVVEVDEEGNIIGSLQGSTGKISHISETAHVGDHIFFGSPINKYLGHLYVGEPYTWEAIGVVGGDGNYKVRMLPNDKDGEESSASSAEEEPPVPETQIFEAMGEGITMKEPKEDTEEIETEESEKLKDDQVDSKEEVTKVQEEISSDHDDTQEKEQMQQKRDQTFEGLQESAQVDSNDINIEVDEQERKSEQQQEEIAETGATAGMEPDNIVNEEVTNLIEEEDIKTDVFAKEEVLDTANIVEEVIETVEAVQEEVIETNDAVQKEVIETDDAVQKEVIETDDTVQEEVKETDDVVQEEVNEESLLAQNNGDLVNDGIPHESKEPMADDIQKQIEESLVDSVSQQQIEEPLIDEQKKEKSEQIEENKEVTHPPQVEDIKDEL